jgi:hypothetical protein
MQARKRSKSSLQAPKKTKRKRSDADEAFEEDLIIVDREDVRNNDEDEQEEDPLANETPAEKRLRIGVVYRTQTE